MQKSRRECAIPNDHIGKAKQIVYFILFFSGLAVLFVLSFLLGLLLAKQKLFTH